MPWKEPSTLSNLIGEVTEIPQDVIGEVTKIR